RLREWYYEAPDKRGSQRQALQVETCFASLLGWIVSWWQGTQLALALDATTLGTCFVVLAVSVVYRGCAIPGRVGNPAREPEASLAEGVAAPVAAAGAGDPPALDRHRAGGPWAVCPLAVSTHRQTGLASVSAHEHGRDLSAHRDLLLSPAAHVCAAAR